MTLVVPGSAQLVGGNERLGRAALRVWFSLIGLALVFVVLLLTTRAFAIGLYANPITLTVLRWAALALGLGWALLFVNAWRIANPSAMSTAGQWIVPAVAFALALAVGWGSWTLSNAFEAQRRLVGNVFTGGGKAETSAGRYNVLLLGGDAGADREGLRPDTMIVASIDADTGRTVLFSLPRNLQWAPFPDSSPLKKLYPNGYWCKDQSCLLNAVYTLAMNHKNLYPGVKNPGVQATKEVVGNILGLDINYYALVDLKGFQALIDAVGGITLDVARKVPIGGGIDPCVEIFATCRQLELDAADFIAIPCNTAHAYISRVQPYLGIPVVNMLAETVAYIHRHHPQRRRVGLLGTSGTIDSRVYHGFVETAGLELVVPDPEHQALVMRAIYGDRGVKAGFTDGLCREDLLCAIEHVVGQGAEIVLLGCTELPLIQAMDEDFRVGDQRVVLLDPTTILAQRCVALVR